MLKKFTIILTVSIILLTNSFAQEDKKLNYGPVIGTGISTMLSDNKFVTENTFGFFAGGFVQYNAPFNINVKLEALYQQSGGDNFDLSRVYASNNILFNDYESSDIDFKNVEIPLQLGYNLFKVAGMQVIPFIGGSVSYNIETKAIIHKEKLTGGKIIKTDVSAEMTDRFEYLSYSAMAGIGLKTQIAGIGFQIDVRYSYGLNNISNYSSADELSVNHGAIALSVMF